MSPSGTKHPHDVAGGFHPHLSPIEVACSNLKQKWINPSNFMVLASDKYRFSPNPKSELDAREIHGLLWDYRGIFTPIKYSEDGTTTYNCHSLN
jgi:hypothetical protein